MRRFYVAIFLLFSVAVSSFFIESRLSASCEEVLKKAEPLRLSLLREDQAESEVLAEEFLSLWEEEKNWLYFLLQHDNLDEAEESGVNLRHAIAVEDWSAALSELTNISHTLSYLSEKDEITLKNLF